jgi:cell division septal protein FtsQ
MAKRRRAFAGLVPQLFRGLFAGLRWLGRHPQPAVATAVMAGVVWALWSFAQRSEAFRITEVTLPSQSSLKLPEPLLGKNMWALDIQALAQALHRQQPWLKTVRVVRQLPSAIRIQAITRIPVAQVKLSWWYPVDRDGFILPESGEAPSPSLIRIVGFDRNRSGLNVGALNTEERFTTALRVVQSLRRTAGPLSRRLTAVDVTDPQQIRLTLDGETEVRCGTESDLGVQLERLRATLKVIAKQSMAVRYIDVRFKEPVIAPRT